MTSPAATSTPAPSTPGLGENIANAASVTWNGIKVAAVAVKDFIIKAAMAIFNFLKNTAQAIWNSKPARYTCAAIASIAAAIGTVFLGIFIANKLKKPDGSKDEKGDKPGGLPIDPLSSEEGKKDPAADLSANKVLPEPILEPKKEEDSKPFINRKEELPPLAEEGTQSKEAEKEKASLLSMLDKPETRKPKILQKSRPQITNGTRRLPSKQNKKANSKKEETQPTALPFLKAENEDDFSDSTIARELAQQEVGNAFQNLLETLENEHKTQLYLQDEAFAKSVADAESDRSESPKRQESAQKHWVQGPKHPETGKARVISHHYNVHGLKEEKVAVRQADGMELLFKRFKQQPREMVTALLTQTKEAFRSPNKG